LLKTFVDSPSAAENGPEEVEKSHSTGVFEVFK
jgi:hypothetical protein